MISARSIQKVYRDEDGGESQVLSGLDLHVQPGELVVITGPSGSGKSTLLHILGGLDVDYSGEVEVAGVQLRGLTDRALADLRNRSVGFVFQSFHLLPTLAAVENVLLPSFFSRGGAVGPPRGRAEEALERVGLLSKKDRLPRQLSGGERQRVAIARALFGKPRALLCDEPTGNLDVVTGQEIISLFRGLSDEGLAVLVATHDGRLSAVAHRVLRLKGGALSPAPAGGAGP